MCSFAISIFLNACESWTLTAELEKRMQAFEICYRRLLNITYKDYVNTGHSMCLTDIFSSLKNKFVSPSLIS